MLVDHFLESAIEVDVDALCDSEDVIIAGIMQHIEEAGIHSGDSSCVLPAVDIREETWRLCAPIRASWPWRSRWWVWSTCNSPSSATPQGKDHVLCDRSEPARLAYRAVCLQGDRHSAGQDGRAADDRPQAARAASGATGLWQGPGNRARTIT